MLTAYRVICDMIYVNKMLYKCRGEGSYYNTATALVWLIGEQNAWSITQKDFQTCLTCNIFRVCSRYTAWSSAKPAALEKWLQGTFFESAYTPVWCYKIWSVSGIPVQVINLFQALYIWHHSLLGSFCQMEKKNIYIYICIYIQVGNPAVGCFNSCIP